MKNKRLIYSIIAVLSLLLGLFFVLLQFYGAAAGMLFLTVILWLNIKNSDKQEKQ